ncbi:MAG: DnaA regulatory inactivator Hda [bacterium]
MKQLPLPIQLTERTTFDNFLAGDNAPAMDCLREAVENANEPQVLIWGQKGRGKTHLLQAVCHHAASQGLRPAYIPLSDGLSCAPDMLDGMERMDLVCVDDVDVVATRALWEEAVFGLVNACRQSGCTLVFSSTQPPGDAGIELPDLRSRLMWGPVFHLQGLNDANLKRSLRRRAEARGLTLDDAVIKFILDRLPRDYGSLIAGIDRLDTEALAQQRRVTVPLVKEALGL